MVEVGKYAGLTLDLCWSLDSCWTNAGHTLDLRSTAAARMMGLHVKRSAGAHDGKHGMYARTMSQHAKTQCRGSRRQAWHARVYDGPARENAMPGLTTASMAWHAWHVGCTHVRCAKTRKRNAGAHDGKHGMYAYARTMGQHAKTQCWDSRRQAWHARNAMLT